MWTDPTNKPTEEGYYLTYYYNKELDQIMYKAFWWDGTDWVPPSKRWETPINVRGYINKPYPYYTLAQWQVLDPQSGR